MRTEKKQQLLKMRLKPNRIVADERTATQQKLHPCYRCLEQKKIKSDKTHCNLMVSETIVR